MLYLSALGVGLGSLVDHHVHTVSGVGYLEFLAPGLLASTAMQVGANEAMYPVMDAIKWGRTYLAMLATPLTARDVLRGHLGWIAFRLVTVCAIYLAIMEAFGTLRSGLAVLAIPAGVLSGLAFVAPIMAFAGAQQNDRGFSALYRFGLIPLFLFSGTFFPVTQLPRWLQFVAWVTPALPRRGAVPRARPRRSGRRAGPRPHGLPRRSSSGSATGSRPGATRRGS